LLNQFAITIDQQNMLIRFAKSKEPKNSEW